MSFSIKILRDFSFGYYIKHIAGQLRTQALGPGSAGLTC